MGIRLLAVTAVACGALAAPAAAQVTVSPLKPCYVSAGRTKEARENVQIAATGFTPGGRVEILLDGVLAATAAADTMGNFAGAIDAPFQASGEAAFSVHVRDQSDPMGLSATLMSRVTDLDARMRPRRADASDRVRLKGRGFTRDAPIFAHYVFDGVRQKRVRLARGPTAPCGTFTARRRQIPIADPGIGEWTIQIDQRRRYSPRPRPVWVQIPVTVRAEFKAP
ncbi:MAG TPA: hypothetical protein VHJ39_10395 [Solirubrobacteraceae bacterium]|jgi:hypothetical protein|nr:hypothetical protein [Solirubrobacteraceae bacterium]